MRLHKVNLLQVHYGSPASPLIIILSPACHIHGERGLPPLSLCNLKNISAAGMKEEWAGYAPLHWQARLHYANVTTIGKDRTQGERQREKEGEQKREKEEERL